MKKSKWLLLVALPAAMVMLFATLVAGAEATGGYASQTRQSCGTCHINPGGGGTLTATGQTFKDGGYVWPIATTTTTAAPTTTTTAAPTTTTTVAPTTAGAPTTTTTPVVTVTDPDGDDAEDDGIESDDDDATETVAESDDDDSEDDGIESVHKSERERGHQHDRENHGHKDGKKSGSALKQETGSFEHRVSKFFREQRFVRDHD